MGQANLTWLLAGWTMFDLLTHLSLLFFFFYNLMHLGTFFVSSQSILEFRFSSSWCHLKISSSLTDLINFILFIFNPTHSEISCFSCSSTQLISQISSYSSSTSTKRIMWLGWVDLHWAELGLSDPFQIGLDMGWALIRRHPSQPNLFSLNLICLLP